MSVLGFFHRLCAISLLPSTSVLQCIFIIINSYFIAETLKAQYADQVSQCKNVLSPKTPRAEYQERQMQTDNWREIRRWQEDVNHPGKQCCQAHSGAAAWLTCCQVSTPTPQCLQYVDIMEEFEGLLWEQMTEVSCGFFQKIFPDLKEGMWKKE